MMWRVFAEYRPILPHYFECFHNYLFFGPVYLFAVIERDSNREPHLVSRDNISSNRNMVISQSAHGFSSPVLPSLPPPELRTSW